MNILIVTHGAFSSALLDSACMIMGEVPNASAIEFEAEDSLETLRGKIESQLDETKPTLILTDIKGGSPFNVSYVLSSIYPNIQLMYGVNLPLLLSVSTLVTSGVTNFDGIFEDYEALIGKIEEE